MWLWVVFTALPPCCRKQSLMQVYRLFLSHIYLFFCIRGQQSGGRQEIGVREGCDVQQRSPTEAEETYLVKNRN